MEKEYIKASEYAKKISLNVRTVYRYYHNGKIKGYQDKETWAAPKILDTRLEVQFFCE